VYPACPGLQASRIWYGGEKGGNREPHCRGPQLDHAADRLARRIIQAPFYSFHYSDVEEVGHMSNLATVNTVDYRRFFIRWLDALNERIL